jgi:hypothetical protein
MQSRPRRLRVQRIPEPVAPELEALGHLMDNAFRVPGTNVRFGLDPVLGLIPGLGDFASTVVSVLILAAGVRYGVPRITLMRMALNIGLDFVVGAIPVVGDVFDVWWKANQRNLALLQSRASAYGPDRRRATAADWGFVLLLVLALLLVLSASIALVWFLFGSLASAIGGAIRG